MRRDVFQAIADPTRREIIKIISRGALNLNSVAANFEISRPAISKHIKILGECGVIIIRQRGRERYCEPNLQSLKTVFNWIEHYRGFWTRKLDALEMHLAQEPAPEKKRIKKIKNKKISRK